MIFAFLLTSVVAQAALNFEPVTLSTQDSFSAPRWMYGVGSMPPNADALTKTRKALADGDFSGCANQARAARPKAKGLQAWLSVIELECAVKAKPTLKSGNDLARALDDSSMHAEWFVNGAQASRLKSAFGAGLLALLDQDLKVNRARAWKSVDRLDQFAMIFDDKSKAAGWRAAGDLALVQQKNAAARDFYRRSLAIVESSDTRDKLRSVEKTMGVVATPAKKPEASSDEVPVVEASDEEIELADHATAAFKAGDVVVAIDSAIQLIQKFPGGSRAKWATDRVNETLATFADKTDIKYLDLHTQVLDRIAKADSDRLTDWARSCYNRAQFSDAAILSKKALVNVDGVRRTKALELASSSAIAVEDWSTARQALQELVDKSAGTTTARDSLFHLGLLSYREGKYAEAITLLERLIAFPQTDHSDLTARYWLWRSLQKMKSDRAARVADDIMTKFPFSYYGLRARLEQGNGTLEWKPPSTEKVESTMWLSSDEKMSWEKAQILMRAGWLEEAQSEIRDLPPPLSANDKAVRALLYAAAGGYVTASKLANDAWDENSDYRRAPFTDAVFPREFTEFIDVNAKKRNLDRDLVRGLIKQESSFNVKAVSSSNAFGLMQMIPPTAKEIAQDLHMPALKLPDDMFVPKRNIEMGTYYLSRMVSKYQGTVPLALAAYNAGPGRIDRWLRTRTSLKTLSGSKSSAVDDEVWIDEIPYSETCFYVKAILRNVMLYRLLDQSRAAGPVAMPDPLWSQKQVQ